MANSNDYNDISLPIGQAGSTLNWTASSGLSTEFAADIDGVDDTTNGALRLAGASNSQEFIYYDLQGGEQFRLDQEDLHIWFFYIKGKGAAVLQDTATTLVVRVYCGAAANGDYQDFHFGGDSALIFGWQTLSVSGLNRDAASGTWQDTDITQNVTRIEIRLLFGTAPTGGEHPPLRVDWLRSGTNITMAAGQNVNFGDIKTYNDNNYLGVVDEIPPVGFVLKCGLTLGDGTVPNRATLLVQGVFILFQHFSEEVTHDFVVTDESDARFGISQGGTGPGAPYAIDGCQLAVSQVVNYTGTVNAESGYCNLEVQDGGGLELYDCKLFRWQDINLGTGASAGANIRLRVLDIDSCNRIRFRQTNIEANNLDIHDNRGRTDVAGDDQCGEVSADPDIFDNVRVHDCERGLDFRANVTVNGYVARDNDTNDLGILEGFTANIVDGEFNEATILRLTV